MELVAGKRRREDLPCLWPRSGLWLCPEVPLFVRTECLQEELAESWVPRALLGVPIVREGVSPLQLRNRARGLCMAPFWGSVCTRTHMHAGTLSLPGRLRVCP